MTAPEPTGRYLRELLGTDFTDEQLAVVAAPLAPQLVVAGAGSGKTTVMAARVVHAVAWHEVPPAQILGLTFTNKAAGQLAESVRRALRRLLPPDALDDEPTVATYHSYAAALLRDHALRIGREPMTQLLTEATRWQLAMRVVRNAEGPFGSISWTPPFVARYLLELDDEMSEHLVGVEEVRAFDAELVAAVDALPKATKAVRGCGEAALARDELLHLVADYRARKLRGDLVDYGDQVAVAAEIARSRPEVGEIERERFRLVLLDEYQDTGVAQRVLLASLYGGGHPVTAVGDPNQAIYGWRGASVGNLLRFGEHFAPDDRVAPQPLMTSFRCGGRILAVADHVARPLRTSPAASRRPLLDVPPLSAPRDREDAGEVVAALLATVDDEAAWVAGQVARAVDEEGVPPGEVAVLCRRRSDFPLLHQALVGRCLPVEVVGLGGLLEMPEVADVVATLRVLADPNAAADLLRLLTGPRWRIGPRDLAALAARARVLAGPTVADDAEPLQRAAMGADPVDVVSLLDALDSLGPEAAYSPEAYARLVALRDELRRMRPLLSQPVVEAVAEVVTRIGLDVEAEAAPQRVAEARAANLAAFLDHAARFAGLDGETDLSAFLAYLAAAADAEDGLDVGGVSAADTVKLLTVHKAKGLEWDVVAVPGLADKVFPSGSSRSRYTGHGKVLPFPLRGDRDDLPAHPPLDSAGLEAFTADCTADDADEERRLGYVAFTRARQRLLVSGYWWGASQKQPKGPSTLLREVNELASAGRVAVDAWEPEPEPDAENPLRGARTVDVPWPVVPDPASLARRRAAADAVRRAAATPPPDALAPAERELVAGWAAEADALVEEARRLRTVRREVELPRRLTASQVVALAEDPDALARRLARPLPQRPVAQARRGSRFHAWVEALHGERPLLGVDELPGAGDADVSDAELAELQERFLASEWAGRRPVAVEAPFELVVDGRLVRGRIDAVYPGADGGFLVVDYKTGAKPADLSAVSLQLSVYRLAWAEIAGVEPVQVDAAFLYVRTGELARPDRLLDAAEVGRLLNAG